MMLVTGSNVNGIKSVSIRVSSDGLSFFNTRGNQISLGIVSHEDIGQIEQQIRYLRKLSSKLELVSESDSFVVIPKELYIESSEATYFAVKSLQYDSEKFIYSHIHIRECIAIVSVDILLIDLISLYFDNIAITHPIVETIKGSLSTGSLVFSLANSKKCAISYSSRGRLIFADYLPLISALDLIYYIGRLTSAHSIDQKERIGYIGDVKVEMLNSIKEKIKNPISAIKR